MFKGDEVEKNLYIQRMTREFIALLLMGLLVSCGKKTENIARDKSSRQERSEAPISREIIKQQKLICHDANKCPEFLTKLVIIDRNQLKYCAGTLIAGNKIVTSASCLPRRFRIPHLNCSDLISAVFTDGSIVRCNKILHSDNNLYKEPALWRNDFVVFDLKKQVDIEPARISTQGLKDEFDYTSWKLVHGDDGESKILKDRCTISHKNYLNPFASSDLSPMHVATDCSLNGQTQGSPLMVGNFLAGIYSQEMGRKMYSYLKLKGLQTTQEQEYFHITNTACSRFLNRNRSYRHSYCEPALSTLYLDKLRANLLGSSELIHANNIRRIKESLNLREKYFKWKVQFVANEAKEKFEISLGRPFCVSEPGKWIGEYRSGWRGRSISTYSKIEVSIPTFVLKTKLDKFLKPFSAVEKGDEKSYFIEFNPYNAYVNKSTDVTISSTLFGGDTTSTYESITTECN